MRTHLLRMADDLDEQGDMLQVNLQLTRIRRDLEEGNPVSEDRWLALGKNYLREEEAYRKAGVDEETLQEIGIVSLVTFLEFRTKLANSSEGR